MLKCTIVVADDNPQNLYLARFLLEKGGYIIIEASNGQEAVEAVCNNECVLALLDIQMPVMDGLEAVKRLKKNRGDLPVVALTAKAMSGDREKILAAGFDGYIEKPIEPERFVSQVERFIVNS